jgi:outer membrane protein
MSKKEMRAGVQFSSMSSMVAITLAALAWTFSGVSVQAAESPVTARIGIVDMQRAIQTVEEGRRAKAQLEKEFTSKKAQLQSEEAAIKKMGEEFKKQVALLSDDARMKKQQEIQERIVRHQEVVARSQQEIQQKEQQLIEPLVRRLRAVIGDLAKSKGISTVLEKNENTVLFYQDKDEITDEVISAFTKGSKG